MVSLELNASFISSWFESFHCFVTVRRNWKNISVALEVSHRFI